MAIEKVTINGEEIALAKSKLWPEVFGWKVVYPIKKNNEPIKLSNLFDGSTNWPNLLFGGWGNLVTLLVVAVIVLAAFYGFNSQIAQCKDLAAHPCKYTNLNCQVSDYRYVQGQNIVPAGLNLSITK